MEDVMDEQLLVIQQIQRSLPNFKKIGKNNLTAAKIRNRLVMLKDLWTKCQTLHRTLQRMAKAEDREGVDSYFKDKLFETAEEQFEQASDFMSEQLEILEPPASPGFAHSSHLQSMMPPSKVLQLPPINLPSFDGNTRSWESFRDRFTALVIGNSDLSDVQRMHYLSSCLTGKAMQSLQNFAVTADNFEIAWEALKSRYDNKRDLVTFHVTSLLDIPQIKTNSAHELRTLRNEAEFSLRSLKNLGRPVDKWEDMVVVNLVRKLDNDTRRAWELSLGASIEIPTYKQFDSFLQTRIRAFESLESGASSSGSTVSSAQKRMSVKSHLVAQDTGVSCPVCQHKHLLSKCSVFLNKHPKQRYAAVKVAKLCINCLSSKHQLATCSNKHRCLKCRAPHHTLLHFDREVPEPESANATGLTHDDNENRVHSNCAVERRLDKARVILATAWVRLKSNSGSEQTVRALLDQGSEMTLVTEHIAQSLRLSRERAAIKVSGVNSVDAGVARSLATVSVMPLDTNNPSFTINALVLKSLTKYVPPRTEIGKQYAHLKNLVRADRNLNGDDAIQIIIGADLYGQLLRPGLRQGLPGEPVAQNTIFGWIVSGPIHTEGKVTPRIITSSHTYDSSALENELRKFWDIESVPTKNAMTLEEQRCEEHFLETYRRDETGRYIVRLPFNSKLPLNLGRSRDKAIRMHRQMEERLARDAEMAKEYRKFMAEYISLGHMAAVTSSGSSRQPYYIPHHAVIRQDSSTSRLRVVFNASSPSTSGKSLNDFLLIGKKLQSDLPAILLRWRQFRYVYTADIEKMYRQILVDSQDLDFQRIVWRENSSDEFQDFHLQTVTYGTASAPFLALRVLQQLVTDEGQHFPLAVPVLREHIYVDDCLFGADDLPLAKRTRQQVNSLLARGGFKLRKWSSNSPELITEIDPTNHGIICDKPFNPDTYVKVLGIAWNPAADTFAFRLALPSRVPTTKRSILSLIAKFFDPHGWVAPVTIVAKILMQSLWMSKSGWDDCLPTDLQSEWNHYYASLETLANLSIPRWTHQGSEVLTMELHGFSDASSRAYAAVIYLKVVTITGEVFISLLSAKTKVAPIKTQSIPRLELCAAVLLARLMTYILESCSFHPVECFCWTDSTIVLAWLRKNPSTWKVFIANRVSLIQTLLPTVTWHHVPTDQNPADIASRGIPVQEFLKHPLWWTGPTWLQLSSDSWPKSPLESDDIEEDEDKRVVSHVAHTSSTSDLASRYSSWPRLLRISAYLLRFITRCRQRVNRKLPEESSPQSHSTVRSFEFRRARILWLRHIQSELFPGDLHCLKKGCSLPPKSRLASLVPYLDSDGLIRVQGRLRNSNLPTDTQHPIIVAKHPLVDLIITHAHLRTLHAGPQLTLCVLRQEFWILRARSVVRGVLLRCVTCARAKAATMNQIMGDLPKGRVNAPCRAFQHCGVDYAGPVLVRASSLRTSRSVKAYISLFVCFATRAIHVELVSDYSTNAFLAAFNRFCARRGVPSAMYSDNGTTFQGADRELSRSLQSTLNDDKFHVRLAEANISWHFIPPSAPHFGGLWEAGVKSVKTHLKRVLGDHKLTYEELSTLLCRIEACLNSRPIAPLSDSLEDYQVLTPGHFLIGAPLTAVPQQSLLELKETRLSRWQLVQQQTEKFWQLWTRDYVHSLQQRTKWRLAQKPIEIGNIVLVRHPTSPPCQWPLARVIAVHSGSDGLTRVVTVRTAAGEYKRPLTQICLLPIPTSTNDTNSVTAGGKS